MLLLLLLIVVGVVVVIVNKEPGKIVTIAKNFAWEWQQSYVIAKYRNSKQRHTYTHTLPATAKSHILFKWEKFTARFVLIVRDMLCTSVALTTSQMTQMRDFRGPQLDEWRF